jgi:hypothetical protein
MVEGDFFLTSPNLCRVTNRFNLCNNGANRVTGWRRRGPGREDGAEEIVVQQPGSFETERPADGDGGGDGGEQGDVVGRWPGKG